MPSPAPAIPELAAKEPERVQQLREPPGAPHPLPTPGFEKEQLQRLAQDPGRHGERVGAGHGCARVGGARVSGEVGLFGGVCRLSVRVRGADPKGSSATSDRMEGAVEHLRGVSGGNRPPDITADRITA